MWSSHFLNSGSSEEEWPLDARSITIKWSNRGFVVAIVQLKGGGGDVGLVLSPGFDTDTNGKHDGDDRKYDDAEDDEGPDGEVAANLVLIVFFQEVYGLASARTHRRRTGKLSSEPLE